MKLCRIICPGPVPISPLLLLLWLTSQGERKCRHWNDATAALYRCCMDYAHCTWHTAQQLLLAAYHANLDKLLVGVSVGVPSRPAEKSKNAEQELESVIRTRPNPTSCDVLCCAGLCWTMLDYAGLCWIYPFFVFAGLICLILAEPWGLQWDGKGRGCKARNKAPCIPICMYDVCSSSLPSFLPSFLTVRYGTCFLSSYIWVCGDALVEYSGGLSMSRKYNISSLGKV